MQFFLQMLIVRAPVEKTLLIGEKPQKRRDCGAVFARGRVRFQQACDMLVKLLVGFCFMKRWNSAGTIFFAIKSPVAPNKTRILGMSFIN